MDAKAATNYCLSKKGAVEDFPFGADVLVVKVVGKMFALISGNGDRIVISLKCDPFLAQDFRQRYAAVTPGYHLNKKHWNTVVLDGTVPEQEIYRMIDHSYELVVKSLTKEQKARIS